MIKANELRIGNLIKFFNGIEKEKMVTINARFFSSFAGGRPLEELKANSEINGYYSPIPLTPEILEKVGFVRVNHINGYSFYSLSRSKKNRCHIDIYPEKTSWMNYTVKHCKSVHELQNLFYSITGEELEIAF